MKRQIHREDRILTHYQSLEQAVNGEDRHNIAYKMKIEEKYLQIDILTEVIPLFALLNFSSWHLSGLIVDWYFYTKLPIYCIVKMHKYIIYS